MPNHNVVEFSIRAKDQFTKVFKSLGSSFTKMASVAKRAAIGIAGVATAVTGFVTVVQNGIDKQAKFASRIGVGVAELSKMQFAAQQSGISIEQMNMATQRMTRRVAEAASGIGEARSALFELGISAQKFKQLKLDDQMARLADAMEQVQDPADKLRLGFKLFDSEGTSMLQMLQGGSEQMRALAKDAAFLGVVISEKSAQSARDFTDQMGRVTSSMKGVSRAIADDLGPVMSGLAKTFANSLANNREAIVAFVSNAVKGVFTLFEVFSQFGDGVKKIFTDVEAFNTFLSNLAKLPGQVLDLALLMGKFLAQGVIEGIKLSMVAFTSFGEWLGTAVAQIVQGDEISNFSEVFGTKMFEGLQAAREKMSSEFDAIKGDVGIAASAIGSSFADAFGINLEQASADAEAVMQKLIDFASTANEAINQTAAVSAENLSVTKSNYEEWIQGMNVSFTDLANGFRDVMTSAIDTVSAGIANALVEGQKMGDVLKLVGKAVLKDLIAMLIKLGVQRLIFSNITSLAIAKESAAQLGASNALAFSAAFASTAAIPITGPALAPGVAAAASAANLAGSAAAGISGAALGAALGGVAHGGLTSVAKESTFLLDKGERVLSPNQNSDLTNFLSGEGSGGGVTIENINLTINTTANSLADIAEEEIEEFVAGPIINALDTLDDAGIRPKALERGNS